MNSKKMNLVIQLFIGSIIIMLIPINAFPYIHFNGLGTGYGTGGESADNNGSTIEMYVVEGAGYFLETQSAIQPFLNRVELQDTGGIDYNELRQLADRALENISNTVETYRQLIAIAENTPYNREAVDKLIRFDYAGFMKENDLSPSIFKKVENYLSRGDITGAFKQAYSTMIAIKELSITVKNEISLNKLPGLPVIWKLSELCSEASLFGSYAARVFHTAF